MLSPQTLQNVQNAMKPGTVYGGRHLCGMLATHDIEADRHGTLGYGLEFLSLWDTDFLATAEGVAHKPAQTKIWIAHGSLDDCLQHLVGFRRRA